MASRYEKMEVMLEEIMQEPSIDAKIDEMKSELKESSQVGGSDRSEYRKNLQNQ